MSSGPIEFMGEEFRDEKPDSEYGGAAGLIQPAEVGGAEAHSELTVSERHGILGRRAVVPVDVHARNEDDPRWQDPIVDPVSGRVVEGDDLGVDVTGKTGRESGLSEVLEAARKPDQHRFGG